MDQNEAHNEQGVTPEINTENTNNMASLLAQDLELISPNRGKSALG